MSALQGKRIVVTRPLPDAKPFADLLAAQGAEPIIAPMIAIQPPEDLSELDDCLRQLDNYDWVIFTSANTVRQVWIRLAALKITPQMKNVAAIGVKTGAALERHGIKPDILPDNHIAEALFDAMAAWGSLKDQRILLPQADRARPTLAKRLTEAGAQVEAITAYRTISAAANAELLAAGFDAITFTSPSTIKSFLSQVDDIGDALVACIGPVTAEQAQQAGLPVHVIANPHTVEGLVQGLSEAFMRMLTK